MAIIGGIPHFQTYPFGSTHEYPHSEPPKVTIIGYTDLAGRMGMQASAMPFGSL